MHTFVSIPLRKHFQRFALVGIASPGKPASYIDAAFETETLAPYTFAGDELFEFVVVVGVIVTIFSPFQAFVVLARYKRN